MFFKNVKNLLRTTIYVISTLFILLGISLFFLTETPGEPFLSHESLEPEILQSIQQHYRTRDPWYKQSWHYFKDIVKGRPVYSLTQQESAISPLLIQGAIVSFSLGIKAFLTATLLGVFLALHLLLHPQNIITKVLATFLLVIFSFPNYIFAFLLRYFTNFLLHTPPPFLLQEILPVIALAIHPTAFITRLVHTNLREISQAEYLLTAQAKGLSPKAILYKHALRNACLPTLGYITPLFAQIITGSFAVEKVFNIRGLGTLCGHAILSRDYPLVLGFTLFYGLLVILTNYVVNYFAYLIHPHTRPR